ncbi:MULTISPECIES: SIMPL domain-containing protein [Pseudoalteromonas]|uniref:SIMPL domain-containing protein n=1 Tax=Pseudoalteromonas TaxID=53246 RepID=UPI0015F4E362|nr:MULTISPECIES: SIMPL domain-containing protein [Pseudoalteromonas]MBA6410236.1 SIMPL domain-containing protein [Pseudoalteromonas sp. 5Ae-yellow]
MKLIITIFLTLFPLITFANSSLPANRHIAVQGTAEVLAKPDMAKISFEVISFKDKSLDAKRDVDDRVNLLLKGLSKYGVKETDVSATSLLTYNDDDKFNVESGTMINAGYVATRTLKVTLRNIEKLNDFIDFALSVKINELTNIELMSSKAAQLKAEATQGAIDNAIVKGGKLAKAFGAELGKIYSINSNSNRSSYGYGVDDFERIVVSGSKVIRNPFEQGRYLQETITFKSSINVVFDLEVNE